MQAKQTKPYVDIMKFIFAIGILLLHGGVIDHLPGSAFITPAFIRLAVPYFFVSSGYFWAKKMHGAKDRAAAKKCTLDYCKRLAIKLIFFEAISIVLYWINRSMEGVSPLKNLLMTVREILFYPSGALWYIQAVIVATLLLAPVVFGQKEKRAIIPALLLYGFAVLGNRYYFLVEGTAVGQFYLLYHRIFMATRNGLFVGVPFMLGGCLLARYEGALLQLAKGQTKRLACAFLLLYAVCIVEILLIMPYNGLNDSALYLSYPLLIPALFMLTAQLQNVRWNTRILRNLSTSIYLLHRPVQMLIGFAAQGLLHTSSVWLISGGSLAVVLAICWVVYKRKWQPLYGLLI